MSDPVALFKALGDPFRFQMIRMIASQPEVACTEFEQAFSISKPTISYHVKTLRSVGLIRIRKDGKYYFYRLSPDLAPAVRRIVEMLLHDEFSLEPVS